MGLGFNAVVGLLAAAPSVLQGDPLLSPAHVQGEVFKAPRLQARPRGGVVMKLPPVIWAG